jgi:hypothetical protein
MFQVRTKLRYFPYVQALRISVCTIPCVRLVCAICCVQYYDSCNVDTVLVVRMLNVVLRVRPSDIHRISETGSAFIMS